ncbi:MAG TPA: RAMP superfamily CRISPR-associated protein [bacterium]|nr:RAMP superfamily CRISPR-associated protein [bacterium]
MTNYKKLNITIELLEDAHIGTGAGGDMTVDAFCQIDKDGFPMIPGSQIKGIMKEVADEFGILEKNEIDDLFGNEGYDKQGKMILRSFYCANKKEHPEDHFTIWQRTSMEDEKKIALDDTLRSFEFVKAETTFGSFVLLPENYADKIEQILKKIDAIGHSRTRGSGLCKITVEDAPLAFEKRGWGRVIFQNENLSQKP